METQEVIASANSVHYIHAIWIAMLVLGLLGGTLSWYKDERDTEKPTDHIVSHLITGILATSMVPLFLQMIGSSLLESLSPHNHSFYVFLSFCSAAAYLSQNFASRVSERMMQNAQEQAEGANRKAEHALKKSEQNFIENLKLQGGILFQNELYDKALIYINEYLKHTPDDVQMLWRKAYVVKRNNDYFQAYELVDKAISLSEKPIALLYFNRACYAALIGKEASQVISDLNEVFRLEGSEQAKMLISEDLTKDLNALMDNPEFRGYLNKKDISVG